MNPFKRVVQWLTADVPKWEWQRNVIEQCVRDIDQQRRGSVSLLPGDSTLDTVAADVARANVFIAAKHDHAACNGRLDDVRKNMAKGKKAGSVTARVLLLEKNVAHLAYICQQLVDANYRRDGGTLPARAYRPADAATPKTEAATRAKRRA